ncbi:MAG: ATP-binding protein [Bacteroidetes bacterium]|nr:ATP-binding protein [Bacteroidota bacterium]
MNPFVIKGYEGAVYFCDREKETERISHAIENQRDLTLVSLRKMGKTGLIFHVFKQMMKSKAYETIYLDIYHTENLNGFINQLATALLRSKKHVGEKVKNFIQSFLFLRPVMSIDPMSGLPSVSFQIADEKDAIRTLEELFQILRERSHSKPIIVAIDEFQQIGNYPEKNVEALIRGMMSLSGNIRFLFSGSNKTLLTRMFGDATRPFYQSTEMMFLEEIESNQYHSFINRHFARNKREIGSDIITDLLTWTRCHTWFTQYVCNKLFEKGKDIDRMIFQDVCRNILFEFSPFYIEYRNLLTRHQWQLLKAIAHEHKVSAITAGDFIKKYNLSNASTVRRSIETLIDKELVYRHGDNYFVYDVFFSRWLETQGK